MFTRKRAIYYYCLVLLPLSKNITNKSCPSIWLWWCIIISLICIQYCYIILDKKIFVMIVPVLIKKKHFGVYFLSHDFTDFLCIKLLYSIQAKMTFYDFVTSKWYIIVCTLHVLYFFSRFRWGFSDTVILKHCRKSQNSTNSHFFTLTANQLLFYVFYLQSFIFKTKIVQLFWDNFCKRDNKIAGESKLMIAAGHLMFIFCAHSIYIRDIVAYTL